MRDSHGPEQASWQPACGIGARHRLAGLLDRIGRSAFLTGQKKDWRADFDFVLQEGSFQKIREGTCGDKGVGVSPAAAEQPANIPAHIAAGMKRTGINTTAMQRWFARVRFEEGGRRIIVPNEFMRAHIVQDFGLKLEAAIGPDVQVITGGVA